MTKRTERQGHLVLATRSLHSRTQSMQGRRHETRNLARLKRLLDVPFFSLSPKPTHTNTEADTGHWTPGAHAPSGYRYLHLTAAHLWLGRLL